MVVEDTGSARLEMVWETVSGNMRAKSSIVIQQQRIMKAMNKNGNESWMKKPGSHFVETTYIAQSAGVTCSNIWHCSAEVLGVPV
jgi:hypothetical protein